MYASLDIDMNKNLSGDVSIPEDWEEIPPRCFDGNKNIISVNIPKNIKKIGFEAFAGCYGLKKVIIENAIEIIESGAFAACHNLHQVNLPEGLKIIGKSAFRVSGLREITIPYSAQIVEDKAFWLCKHLTKVNMLNPETKLGVSVFYECENIKKSQCGDLISSEKHFHLMGKPFLRQCTNSSANYNHTKDMEFKELATLCAKGNADAMNAFAEYFEKKYHKWFASKFYIRAANYWRYRAYHKGHKDAIAWFNNYFTKHPGKQLESILSESCDHRGTYDYHHDISGKMLNDLGFDFFSSTRKYDIRKYDSEDIVEVSSFADYEGSDSDGFGDEWNYDWWFLDENMQPIPGIKKLYGEIKNVDDFKYIRDEAKKIVKQR